VNIQEAPDPAVKIYPAPLKTSSKEAALPDVQNLSDHSQTIRMCKASNADTIADFNLCHVSPFRTISGSQLKIILRCRRPGQEKSAFMSLKFDV
jgi:hypothetical protein